MPKEYTLIGGNGTRVSPLEVTESGTYEAGDSRAFNPVKVNVPSGSSTLSGLTDVDISNPTDGQTLVYNAESGKWENGAGGGGVLVCHIVMSDETPTLDKTYREIVNADMAILKVIDEEEGLSGLLYLSGFQNLPGDAKSGAKSDAKATGWSGILTFVDVASTVENGVLSQYDYVVDDPDDYPVAST